MDIDAGNKEPTTPAAAPAPDSKYSPTPAGPTAAPPATPVKPPSGSATAVAPDLAIALAIKEARARERRQHASAACTPATSQPPAQTTGEAAAAAVPGPGILKRTVSQALGPRPGPASATGSQAPRPAVSLAQLYGSSAPTSHQLGLPRAPSAFSAKEADRKSAEWFNSVRARLGAAAARPAAMDVEPTRSVRARRSAAAAATLSDGDVASGDDEPSDAESTGSQGDGDSRAGSDDAVRLLTVLCDISAFNAECLAKLAGVPMPDFDAAGDQ